MKVVVPLVLDTTVLEKLVKLVGDEEIIIDLQGVSAAVVGTPSHTRADATLPALPSVRPEPLVVYEKGDRVRLQDGEEATIFKRHANNTYDLVTKNGLLLDKPVTEIRERVADVLPSD